MATAIGQTPLQMSTDSLHQNILALETRTWEALKTSGQALIPYLDADTVMIFPGATILSAQSEPRLIDILSRPDMKPWTHYELSDVHVLPIGAQGASISYRVNASRGDMDHAMLVTSVWRESSAGWMMILHQQTPLA